jgi:hypothetical protein
LIDDLPEEDQLAISAVVGTPVLLNKYERDGRAELQERKARTILLNGVGWTSRKTPATGEVFFS